MKYVVILKNGMAVEVERATGDFIDEITTCLQEGFLLQLKEDIWLNPDEIAMVQKVEEGRGKILVPAPQAQVIDFNKIRKE